SFDSEVLRANAARFSVPRFHREVVAVLAPFAVDEPARLPAQMSLGMSPERHATDQPAALGTAAGTASSRCKS
ncbi:MAG: hypothetical protein M3P18_20230, partial [Actinomycetota bacterium]|nr:hypothetical protein [Actinomycetota bacterium]